jgi:hypothetical protein
MCRTTLAADATGGDGGKLVTVVTSDLKGSTALGEKLDPESLREVLNRYFAVMRVVFESHGGSIEKIIGDAIVAVFGLPFRHDDDPIRAVEAAAETHAPGHSTRELGSVGRPPREPDRYGDRIVPSAGTPRAARPVGGDGQSTAMEQSPARGLVAVDLSRDPRSRGRRGYGLKSPKNRPQIGRNLAA